MVASLQRLQQHSELLAGVARQLCQAEQAPAVTA